MRIFISASHPNLRHSAMAQTEPIAEGLLFSLAFPQTDILQPAYFLPILNVRIWGGKRSLIQTSFNDRIVLKTDVRSDFVEMQQICEQAPTSFGKRVVSQN